MIDDEKMGIIGEKYVANYLTECECKTTNEGIDASINIILLIIWIMIGNSDFDTAIEVLNRIKSYFESINPNKKTKH